MSNTCEIKLTIRHTDPVMMKKAIDAFDTEFLETMLPLPEGQDSNDYYGTWWINAEEEMVDEIEEVYCTSANVPPLEAFDLLSKQGYYIEATFFEPASYFYGYYSSTEGTNWIDYTDEDEIPEEIIDLFNYEIC